MDVTITYETGVFAQLMKNHNANLQENQIN